MQELKLFEGGHFRVSEQGQLKNRLSRWAALTDAQVPEFNKTCCPKARMFFLWLNQQLNKIEFSL